MASRSPRKTEVRLFTLEGSNGYATAMLRLPDLAAVTRSYLALRALPTYRDCVWTLIAPDGSWLYDAGLGEGPPVWTGSPQTA
jgi:hypothetical protein